MTDNSTAVAAGESQFEKLIGDLGLGDMSKALKGDDAGEGADTAADDAKIAAAAEDGEAAGEGEGEGEGAPLGKSLQITLEDGSTVDAVDGTELVKSLIERFETNEAVMAKALTDVAGALGTAVDMVKSLQGEVTALKNKGVGRKTVLAITETPAAVAELAKSDQAASAGMTAEAFMAKSMALNAKGLVTSREVANIEAHLNAGQQPPAPIVAKVAALIEAGN